MKRELDDLELEEVTGGTVVLSAPMGKVRFTAIGKTCKIKGDVKEMRNLLISLYDDNENMSDAEFDRLVLNAFASRGWI